jgi:hypothetical protein
MAVKGVSTPELGYVELIEPVRSNSTARSCIVGYQSPARQGRGEPKSGERQRLLDRRCWTIESSEEG